MKNVIGFSCMLKCKQKYEYAQQSTLDTNVRSLITGFTDGTQYSKGTWVYFILIVLSKLVWRNCMFFFFCNLQYKQIAKTFTIKSVSFIACFFFDRGYSPVCCGTENCNAPPKPEPEITTPETPETPTPETSSGSKLVASLTLLVVSVAAFF